MSGFQEVIFSPINQPSGEGIELGQLSRGQQLNLYQTSISTRKWSHSSSDSDKVSEHAELGGGQSSVYGASFNFVNSIVGAGIIAIPQAIQECGLLLGVFMLLIVAYLVNCSVLMLIECGIKADKYDLEVLSEHLLGRKGYYFALAFMFIFGYGAQVAYLVIIGDTVPKAAELLFPGTIFCDRQATLWLTATLFVLPLCLFRNLSTLSWTSMISVIADLLIVLIVLYACASLHSSQDQHFEASDTGEIKDSVFEGVGTMSFAFVCQHNSFMVFRSLAQPTYSEWKKVAGISVGFSCAVCIGFGLIGFFTFYPYVNGDLLNNFPVNNVTIATARLFLAVTMVLTYPMECYVTRHCVVAFWAKYTQTDAHCSRNETGAAKGYSNNNKTVVPEVSPISTVHATAQSILDAVDSATTAASVAMHSALHTLGVSNHSTTAVEDSSHSSASGASHTGSKRSSPRKSRRQGQSKYTNIQAESDGDALHQFQQDEEEQDVTIMFMENKVLMLYDVAIEETDSPAPAAGLSGKSDRQSNNGSIHEGRSTSAKRLIETSDLQNNYASEIHNSGKYSPNEDQQQQQQDQDQYVPPAASLPVHVLLTLLLWASTLAVALVCKQLGVVSALTGAVAASMLGFVLPATLYMKTHEPALRHACTAGRALLSELMCGTSTTMKRVASYDSDYGAGMEEGDSGNSGDSGSKSGSSGGYRNILHQRDHLHARHQEEGLNVEEGEAEVTVTFQHTNAMDDLEFSPPSTSTAPVPRTVPGTALQRNQSRRSCCTIVLELHSLFKRFYLSFALVVFGFAALIIGVTTVLVTST